MRQFIIPLFLVLICACQPQEKIKAEIEKKVDWAEIKEKEVLTILAENGPASFFIYKGKNMGYEYELLHEFAKDNDIRINVKMVQNLDSIYSMLNNFEGDLLACNLTITPERQEIVQFSKPHLTSRQVLIQRKPEGWRKMRSQQIQDSLIKEVEALKNKTIHVWNNSTHRGQIEKINELLNLNLNIVALDGDVTTEEIIRMVSKGIIEYTITDENIAKANQFYTPNLDISLHLSSEESLAFAARLHSTTLIDTINAWLIDPKNRSTIGEVRRKYFERRSLSTKASREFSSTMDGQLSPYDDIIQKESEKLGWDWRLVSAIIYQESKFETYKISWAGAFGIFQFMPATAESYGISPSSSAQAQIKAGIKKLNKNYNQWLPLVPDSTEAIYFTLATFNSGRAHIDDARSLAAYYSKDTSTWYGHVDSMVLNLSKPKYYRNPVVKYGYARGLETYEYIYEIMERFEEYKHAFPTEEEKTKTKKTN